MKKLICFILALTIVMTATPVFAAETVFTYYTDDGLCAVVDTSAKTLTVSGEGDMADYTADSRPAWYEKKSSYTKVIIEDGITSIGDYAFADNLVLVSASVPDSVTSIGDYAFHHCIKLTEMHLSNNVKEIGIYALADCISLKTVTLPDSLTEIPRALFRCSYYIETVKMPTDCPVIGGQAFLSCSYIKSLQFPKNLKFIGDFAFNACNALTSVELPEGTEYIGNFAFYQLTKLAEITIPKTVTFIGEDAFCSTPWYNALPDGFNLINGIAITYKGTPEGKTLTLPYGTLTVSPGVCGKANYITEIIIPDTVKTVCEEAFYNLTSLYSVTVPESVTEIGSHAFGYVSSSSGAPSPMYPYTIYSVGGSAAHTYAIENRFDFVCLHKEGAFAEYPDCTEGGFAKSACIYCGEVLGKVLIKAGSHVMGSKETTTATCTEDGLQINVCALCGYETVSVTEKAKGHTQDSSGIQIKEATCGENGLIYKTCADCGESFDGIVIEKKSHTPSDSHTVTKAPGCTEDGEYSVLCRDCGEVLETGAMPAVGHSVSSTYTVLSESDCLKGVKGLRIKECTVCHIVTEYSYFLRGDLNSDGRINTRDAVSLKKVIAQPVDENTKFLGDVNADGRINSRDSLYLVRTISNS